MESLLNEATVCRLACTDKSKPYIVPLSFGYHEGVISLHSANEGKKITLIRKNPACCIEFDKCREVVKIGYPCNREMYYREGSVIRVDIAEMTGKKHGADFVRDDFS